MSLADESTHFNASMFLVRQVKLNPFFDGLFVTIAAVILGCEA
ncbi:hypothetical protein [Shewanella sp. AC91-MNA-CIBAN-0169]